MNKMENKKITVIIPIAQITDKEYELFLEPALNSLLAQKSNIFNILFTLTSEVFNTSLKENILKNFEASFKEQDVNISFLKIENNDINFSLLVNKAVENINTDYFMVLEQKDMLNHKWFENFEEYNKAFPNVKMFIPIVTHLDEQNNYLTLQNEIAWAMQAIDEHDGKMEVESVGVEDLGYIRFDSVLKKMKYSLAGSIYNKKAFEEVGKFKPSHLLHFDYEFLLRFLYQGNEVMVIPRAGIKHTNVQPDDSISLDEKKFWYSLAKKEYMFPQDRNIKYQSENIEETT